MNQSSPSLVRHIKNHENAAEALILKHLREQTLYNDQTFYEAFTRDLLEAKKEVVIYCPFVTKYRSEYFRRTLQELKRRNIAVFIFTRPLEEHDMVMKSEVMCALRDYEELGACLVYLPGYIHEKLAVIDRLILWEGSLNILSQRKSRELMRRIPDDVTVKHTMQYLGINRQLATAYKAQYERLYRSLADGASERRIRARWIGLGLTGAILGIWLLIAITTTIGTSGIWGVLRLILG